ncbi:hypothetical protein T06_6973 [Trichinella sp. T6]|nr:hypothetical protein T06_6973 [Trichinella sp. T6]
MMWECRRTPANYLHARISSNVPLTMVVRNWCVHTVSFGRQSAVLIEHTLLHILVSWTVRSCDVRKYGWFAFSRLSAAEVGHASSKLVRNVRVQIPIACGHFARLHDVDVAGGDTQIAAVRWGTLQTAQADVGFTKISQTSRRNGPGKLPGCTEHVADNPIQRVPWFSFDIEAVCRVCGPPSCSVLNQLVIFIRHRWCHCSISPPQPPPAAANSSCPKILAQLI